MLRVQDPFHRLLLHGVSEVSSNLQTLSISWYICFPGSVLYIVTHIFKSIEILQSNLSSCLLFKRINNVGSFYYLVILKIAFEQFYDLVSVTATQSEGTESLKTTRVKKKKASSVELPNITLCQFLKMAKEGIW